MPEERTIETPDLQNLQVDGAKILSDLGPTTPIMPLTLESLFKLITTHEHKGSDGSETLRQGRIVMGQTSYDAGTGTQTITHDLNKVPRFILIFAVGLSGSVQGVMSIGWAKGIATGEYDVIFSDFGSSSFSANRIVEVRIGSGNSLTATITRLDTTEFALSWTLTGGSFTCRYIWALFS